MTDLKVGQVVDLIDPKGQPCVGVVTAQYARPGKTPMAEIRVYGRNPAWPYYVAPDGSQPWPGGAKVVPYAHGVEVHTA